MSPTFSPRVVALLEKRVRQPMDLSMLTRDELEALRENTQERLDANQERGASALLLSILSEIVDTATAELAKHEGANA